MKEGKGTGARRQFSYRLEVRETLLKGEGEMRKRKGRQTEKKREEKKKLEHKMCNLQHNLWTLLRGRNLRSGGGEQVNVPEN